MPPVFGRNDRDPHPYDVLLDDLFSGETEERAVACNVRYDGRVSQKREAKFDQSFEDRINGQDLLNALTLYKENNIRKLKQPDFNLVALNGDNFRIGHPDRDDSIHKDVLLARVLIVNELETVVRAHGRREAAFRRYRDIAVLGFDSWLDREIGRQGKELFVSAVLRSLNQSRRQRPFQPSWVTYWDRVEPYLSGPPHRWLETLGIHQELPGRWLLVLRYPARAAGKLIRPTVLEAGPEPRHFPTPESSATGHPIELGTMPIDGSLLPELVHRQIDHDPDAHWRAAGSRLERTTKPTNGELIRQRRSHFERLEGRYGGSVLRWQPI